MDDFIYDLTTLITQASIKFPHSKVIYSSLLPCADIPIYKINYINQQLIAACSKLPNVVLVGHENLFAYGPDVLHDNRHVKKRHIGLFATILINAVRGKIRPTRALRPRNTFTPIQRPPPSPMEKYTSNINAVQKNQVRLFSQQTPPAEYQETRSPFLRQKMEQGQRYNDAILNELMSFFKILLNHTFKIHRTFFFG